MASTKLACGAIIIKLIKTYKGFFSFPFHVTLKEPINIKMLQKALLAHFVLMKSII